MVAGTKVYLLYIATMWDDEQKDGKTAEVEEWFKRRYTPLCDEGIKAYLAARWVKRCPL
jgi:hypothetical protein